MEQMNNLANSRRIIGDVTETLSAVSEENAASSEQTAASMQLLSETISNCTSEVKVLNDLGQSLKEQISIFKTNSKDQKQS